MPTPRQKFALAVAPAVVAVATGFCYRDLSDITREWTQAKRLDVAAGNLQTAFETRMTAAAALAEGRITLAEAATAFEDVARGPGRTGPVSPTVAARKAAVAALSLIDDLTRRAEVRRRLAAEFDALYPGAEFVAPD